jgi:cytidyltransferase-like protein
MEQDLCLGKIIFVARVWIVCRYIAGSWDLFNVGHIKALEKAREYGSFVLVGIHDDDTVNRLQGGGFPILNLNERTMRQDRESALCFSFCTHA